MQRSKWPSGLRHILLLIVCVGAIAWAWKHVGQTERNPTTTADWVDMAGSGDADERKLALRKLEPLNAEEARAARAAAMGALKDADAGVRSEAALAMGRIAVPRSLPDGAVDAARALEIAAMLAELLRRDPDGGVRASAANGLSAIYGALVAAGTRPEELPADDPLRPETLVAAFDGAIQSDPSTRLAFVTAMGSLGPVPMPAPPGLLSALDDPAHSVRGLVLLALAHFSGGVDRAVPVLLGDVATNPDRFPPDYEAIARGLHPSPAVVPSLLEALKSPNGLVRETAASLLTRVEPPPKTAAPAVIAAVKDALATAEAPDASPGKSAPAKGFGPSAGHHREPLPPGSVSTDLAIALVRVAPAGEAMPLLVRMLKRKGPATRGAGAEGLAQIGPPADDAIPDLIATLKDAVDARGGSGAGYGAAAARALGRIAPAPATSDPAVQNAVAALTGALKADSTAIRASAAEALGNFGPMAAPAIRALRGLSKDRITPVRDAAAAALKKIEPAKAPATGSSAS